MVPYGIHEPDNTRGPFHHYLGSYTNQTTSVIQSWEKDTDITFIRKAGNMRKTLNWFVNPDSKLGQMILSNLESLIGEYPGDSKDKGIDQDQHYTDSPVQEYLLGDISQMLIPMEHEC